MSSFPTGDASRWCCSSNKFCLTICTRRLRRRTLCCTLSCAVISTLSTAQRHSTRQTRTRSLLIWPAPVVQFIYLVLDFSKLLGNRYFNTCMHYLASRLTDWPTVSLSDWFSKGTSCRVPDLKTFVHQLQRLVQLKIVSIRTWQHILVCLYDMYWLLKSCNIDNGS